MAVDKARADWLDPALGATFARWLDELSSTTFDVRNSPRQRDLSIIRAHLLPRFGPMQLASITQTEVRGLISDLVAAGRRSPSTVRKIGQVLSKIMNAAVEARLIGRSPCAGVKLPAEPRREMRFLTPEEVARLGAAIDPN